MLPRQSGDATEDLEISIRAIHSDTSSLIHNKLIRLTCCRNLRLGVLSRVVYFTHGVGTLHVDRRCDDNTVKSAIV